MNPTKKTIAAIAASALFGISAFAQSVETKNVEINVSEKYLDISADIVLDRLKLRSNQQILITPIIRDHVSEHPDSSYSSAPGYSGMKAEGSKSLTLPSLLVSGRNMHISYERGVLRNFKAIKNHKIWKELKRDNGKPQTETYSARIPVEDWMRANGTGVFFVYDSCGCGAELAQRISDPVYISEPLIPIENPVKEMNAFMIIPEIEDIPVQIHEGRARVQFEVDRTALHINPYVCRNGQVIDNREQLKIIDDSVKYALSDPNVELTKIEICGYASPESPYLHNEELATGRSKVLSEYLADFYNLPRGSVTYSAVPENWGEFRDTVVKSHELTERQRQLLLDLIDEPAYTPEEFDRKEWLLKTDPRYAQLYRTKILPQWFPRLRATTFAVHTKLKPTDDNHLAEIIKSTPEKMSLNQMYRVARMYPSDSDEFNDVMLTALKYYPKEQVAITNAATAAINRGEYARAKQLLDEAEKTSSVYNLLGIIATSEGNYEEAARYFDLAGDNQDAKRNKSMLKLK